jgi:lauroyl/myristoyl acyltransferase
MVKVRNPAPRPWLEAVDLRVLSKLPLATAIAWSAPEGQWERLALAAASLQAGARARAAGQIGAGYGAVPPPEPLAKIALRHVAMLRIDQLLYLRSRAPHGWRVDLPVEGQVHLQEALALGRGAILWVAPTVFAPLIAKRALHAAGHALHHLSHPAHGFSSQSRLGEALINPLRTGVENRYLAERVMLGSGNEAQGALRRIAALLRGNAVVSISVGRKGSRVAEAAMLGGRLRVASGAPHLAASLGAALLPTTVARNRAGTFVTQIWPPLPVGRDTPLSTAVAGLAGILEEFARAHPEQIHWADSSIGPAVQPGGP